MGPKPPPPSPSSYTSFPILAISVLGILATAILLLSYYLFVVKCCLHWRRPRLLLLGSRRQRHQFTHRHRQGLDSSTINAIPTFRFAKSSSAVECAVCLADFRENELLRLLPNCSHSFHIDCIDVWLQFNPNCPLCRNDTSLTPIQPQQATITQHSSIDNSTSTSETKTTTRRLWKMVSMGDEYIDTRDKDERFEVQPIRRSFSLNSSGDRHLCVSMQEILRQNPNLFPDVGNNGEGSNGGGSGGVRIWRPLFSFGRSSSGAASVLPVQNEMS